jgi:class 3 adenylate cyclase/tetratricopeptide (TPR) repeat protein
MSDRAFDQPETGRPRGTCRPTGRLTALAPAHAAAARCPSRRRVIQEGQSLVFPGKPMRCTSCGSENPDSKRFCGNCGSPLGNRCARCGVENPAGQKFCGDCGADLSQPTAAPQSATPSSIEHGKPHEVPEGERRHLTVLFCDLVGSTEIASHLDPEEWREIVGEYHRAAAQAIERFGGSVAQYLGDGVMAYFGWPEAHDNDAERAARAGLAILEAITKLNEHPARPKLAARVGIDSGTVVVGAGAGKDSDVFGDTPNIAARVQSAAEPGTVVITDAVHRLISGLFVVEDRGAQALKGIERPVQLYRVVQPSGVRGRFEAAAATRGLTPFVGREDELRLLMSRWERALEGEGQVTLIIGEAGIGKSRLVQRFREQIAGTPHTWVEAAAGAFFQNTPFYAVTEMLREHLGWRGDASAEEQLAQLETRLELAGLKPAEALSLIAPLLNLPLPAKYPPSLLSPEQQRRRLLATLVEWALGAARVQPTVIAIEDLHWADPSTLELLQLLVEQGATARLLLLYTVRPEFRAQWPLRAHHTQITLNRLSSRNVRTMMGEVAAQKALSEETIATVVQRTGGVPLFVEEMTRAVLESGNSRLTGHEIPATLHDSLMARLDRLGPAKEVVQVGAVIGSDFSYGLLHAVHPLAEEDLQRALRNLADAELLYVRGIAPEATYQFKHALIRDAAYEALLRSRRKDLHRLVARTIDEKFPAVKEAHPEVLARHWTEAGETEPAIAAWSRAGTAAEARNAFSEALESYQQALVLLKLLPESPERDLRELDLRYSILSTIHVTRGFSAPDAIGAAECAAALAAKTGNLTRLVSSMVGRGTTAFVSGDLPTARALADQALELAIREGGPTSLGLAHCFQIVTRYLHGDLAGAEKHFTTCLKFFDDPGLRHRQISGLALVAGFAHASRNAWTLGRADVARERMAEMMAAVNANNPYGVAFSVYCAAYLRIYLREYEQAEALAARALEMSEKHQFPGIAASSRCVLGQARTHLGRTTEGIALIRQGMADMLEGGSRFSVSNFTGWMAAAQEREGAIVHALETVEQALLANPDELVHRPEIFRLRGELRAQQGQTELAEADFRESIALAQKMSAKGWELRATTSLARLLSKQGKRDEARVMLAEIYGWFTEGFDTRDLKDAKMLLDELGV